jgi:hypothetical protein
MALSAKAAPLQDILGWRDWYRPEMNCQIVHDMTSESILVHDKLTTAHAVPEAVFRRATPADGAHIRNGSLAG